MTSLNLRYHALSHGNGRSYIQDATTAAPVGADYSNMHPADAAGLTLAMNLENGCYVQHGEHTYRLRTDRVAVLRIENNMTLVCSLPVVTERGDKARITVPARDGVHIARFVGMAVDAYDPADPSGDTIPLIPARS